MPNQTTASTNYSRTAAAIAQAVQTSAQEALSAALSAVPSHVRVITLEVDAKSSTLYLASIQHGASPEQVMTTVRRAGYSPSALSALTERLADWETALRTHTTCATEDQARRESELALAWNAVVADMHQLLAPFSESLTAAAAVRPGSSEQAKPNSPQGKGAQPGPAHAAVVLCVAEALAALPLEALPALARAGAVVRDLSVFALAQRAQAGDASAPLTSAIEWHSEQVDEAFSKDIFSVHGQGWTGQPLRHCAEQSSGEQVRQLQTANALVFCSHERLAQTVPLSVLVTADLSSLMWAVVLDGTLSAASTSSHPFAQQRSSKVASATWRPDAVGALLAQRGARCCVMSRYACSLQRALHECSTMFTASSGGKPLAEAARGVAAEAERQPWAPYLFVTVGLPHLVLEAGKVGKKK